MPNDLPISKERIQFVRQWFAENRGIELTPDQLTSHLVGILNKINVEYEKLTGKRLTYDELVEILDQINNDA